MSLPDFRKLQEEDEYCNKIKQLAERDQIAKYFHIRQGILIRIFSPSKDDPDRRKIRPPTIVLPAVLVNMIIDSEHQGPLGAHLAPKRVFLSLRERYHFPSMEAQVTQRIKQCVPCQLNMYTTTKSHKLHMTTTSSKPRSTVGIDIAPDFPPDRGHHHIIIFVDFASNFVTIKPLKTRTSKEILEKFLEHVAMFEIPHTVRHDKKKGITEGDFKRFCETNMIEQVTGLPNKGQTNGRVESQIRNIKHALRSTTTSNSSKDKWRDKLWKIQLSFCLLYTSPSPRD